VTSVSTHILDTARGRPAAGVPVSLGVWADGGWQRLGEAITGPDGRVTALPEVGAVGPASCQLVFAVEEYLVTHHGAAFYPEIAVAFVAQPGVHYHVPLLLAPFGYSTYRGS
jgi:5-hydroxyisourate hydrolase